MSYPVAGVDYPVVYVKMHLRAHAVWRRAFERGLVSAAEWRRYEELINTHPMSWKGWLRWAGTRPRS